MLPLSLLVFTLIQISIANSEDPFRDQPADLFAGYTEDLADPEGSEAEKRNGDFLRFGRGGSENYIYDDPGKPKRNAIRKNDNFIRFGRNGNKFLRFGRDQNKALRNGEIYLRFGRSAMEEEQGQPRSKRSTNPDEYPKRKDAFLRFGRDPGVTGSESELRIPPDSPLVYVLAELLARKGGRWHGQNDQ